MLLSTSANECVHLQFMIAAFCLAFVSQPLPSLSLSLYPSLSLSLSIPPSLSLSISPSLPLSLSLHPSLSLSLSIPPSLSLSLSLSPSLPLSLSLSLSPSLLPSPFSRSIYLFSLIFMYSNLEVCRARPIEFPPTHPIILSLTSSLVIVLFPFNSFPKALPLLSPSLL